MLTPKARLRRLGAAPLVLSLLGAALSTASPAQSFGHPGQIICRQVADVNVMFRPNTSEIEIAQVLSRVMVARGGPEYQLNTRWSTTARGATGAQGNPITLGYSYVPDGVTVPDQGLGSGGNQLNARLTSLFGGSTALWKSKFAASFQRWADLTGLSYVEEPDDAAALHASPGVVGTRGDSRISMIPFNDNNVLAYNFFPNTGDMVLNYNINWASSSADYRFLRNVVMHEHGHGMGLSHVDSNNSAQLMEPFIDTSFDGPQHDDIQGGQRHYGDNDENNDTAATRKDLGTVTNGMSRTNLSLDSSSDIDWYRVLVPAGFNLTVTASPVGMTYNQGPQGGAQTPRNSLAIQNLRLGAYQSNGTTPIAGPQDSAGIGAAEVLTNIVPSGGGEVYLAVDSATATNDIQLYTLTFNLVVSGPALTALTLDAASATAGDVVGGTVTLSQAAGAGGITVNLSSSNTNAATVPPTVDVPQGSTSAQFNVTTLAGVVSQTVVTITGEYLGTQRTDDLTIIPAPQVFGPTAVSVSPGTVLSGGLPELQVSDDLRWVARPGSVLVSTQSPLVITLNTVSTVLTPVQIEFGIESSASASNLNRKIEILDWFSAVYLTLANGTESLSDTLTTYQITTNPELYVHPDGTMQVKISYKPNGAVLVYPWQVRLDRVYWKLWP